VLWAKAVGTNAGPVMRMATIAVCTILRNIGVSSGREGRMRCADQSRRMSDRRLRGPAGAVSFGAGAGIPRWHLDEERIDSPGTLAPFERLAPRKARHDRESCSRIAVI
jgi:hypothetical protein